MIYELRVYTTVPGRMPALQARFATTRCASGNATASARWGSGRCWWAPDNNDLTYMIVWESLAERELKWAAFLADPEWQAVRAATEKDGPINARIANSFLTPTAFSALQ